MADDIHDPSELSITDVPSRQRFEARTPDGEVAGFAAYQRRANVVVLTHTEVDDAYQGIGAASRLARVALEQIRAEGLSVDPQCSYMADFIDKHPEYADLAG